jgi:hypothetical protein
MQFAFTKFPLAPRPYQRHPAIALAYELVEPAIDFQEQTRSGKDVLRPGFSPFLKFDSRERCVTPGAANERASDTGALHIKMHLHLERVDEATAGKGENQDYPRAFAGLRKAGTLPVRMT